MSQDDQVDTGGVGMFGFIESKGGIPSASNHTESKGDFPDGYDDCPQLEDDVDMEPGYGPDDDHDEQDDGQGGADLLDLVNSDSYQPQFDGLARTIPHEVCPSTGPVISKEMLDMIPAAGNPGAPHSMLLRRHDGTKEHAHVYAITLPVRSVADEMCLSSIITSADPRTAAMCVDPCHSTFLTVMLSIMMALPRVHGARDDTTSVIFQMFPADRLRRVWDVPAVRIIVHYIAPRASATAEWLAQVSNSAEEALLDTSKMKPAAIARHLFKVVSTFARSPSKLYALYVSMDAMMGSNLDTPLDTLFPYMSPKMHSQLQQPRVRQAFYALVDNLFHQRDGVNIHRHRHTGPSFRPPPPTPYPGDAIQVGPGSSTPFYGFAEISGKALARVNHMRVLHPHYFAAGAVAHVRTFSTLMARSAMKCPDLMATPSVIAEVLLRGGDYVDLMMTYDYSTSQLEALGVDKETIDPEFFFPTVWSPADADQPHSTPAMTPMNEHLQDQRLMTSPLLYLPTAVDRLRLRQMPDYGKALLKEVHSMCETSADCDTLRVPMAARMMIWSVPAPHRYASVLMRRPQILPRWSDPEHMIAAMHHAKESTRIDPVMHALLSEISNIVAPIATDTNSFNTKFPVQSYIDCRRAYHRNETSAEMDRLASNVSVYHGLSDPGAHGLSTLPRWEVTIRSQYELEGCISGALLPWIRAVSAVTGNSSTPEQPLDREALAQVAAEVIGHYGVSVHHVRSAIQSIADVSPDSACAAMVVSSAASGQHDVYPRTSATAQGRAQVAGQQLQSKLSSMQADSAVFPASTPGAYSSQLSPHADLISQLASELFTRCNLAGDKLVHITSVVVAATSSGDVPSAVHIGSIGPTTCGKSVGLQIVMQLSPPGIVKSVESVSAKWVHDGVETSRFRPLLMNEIRWRQIGNSAVGDSDSSSEEQCNLLHALESAWTDGTRIGKSKDDDDFKAKPFRSNTQFQVFYTTNTPTLHHSAAIYARIFAYRMNALPDQLARPLDLSALNHGNFVSAYRRMWRGTFELNLLMNTQCMPSPSTSSASLLFNRFISMYKSIIKSETLDPEISKRAPPKEESKWGDAKNDQAQPEPTIARQSDERFTLNRQTPIILGGFLQQLIIQRVLLTVTQHMQPFFAALPGITSAHIYAVVGAYIIGRPDDVIMSFMPISLLDRRYLDRKTAGVTASTFSGIVRSFVMFLVRMAELIRDAGTIKGMKDLDSTLCHLQVDLSAERTSSTIRHTPHSVLRSVLSGDVDSVFVLTRMDSVDLQHENFRWILIAAMRFYRLTSTLVCTSRQHPSCKVSMSNSSKKYYSPMRSANIVTPDKPDDMGRIRTDDMPFVYAHCIDAAMSSLAFFVAIERADIHPTAPHRVDEKTHLVEPYPEWNARMVRIHVAASLSRESFAFIIPAAVHPRGTSIAYDALGSDHTRLLQSVVPHEVLHTWALSDIVQPQHGWRPQKRADKGLCKIDLFVTDFTKWMNADTRVQPAAPSVGQLLPPLMRRSFKAFEPLRDVELNALDPLRTVDLAAIIGAARSSSSSSSSPSSSPLGMSSSSSDEQMVSQFPSYNANSSTSGPQTDPTDMVGGHRRSRVSQVVASDALEDVTNLAIEVSTHRLNRFITIIVPPASGQPEAKPFKDTDFPHIVFDAMGTMELSVPPSVEAMRRVIQDHMNPMKGDALLWRHGCSSIAAPIRADGATVIDVPSVPSDDPRLKRTTMFPMGKLNQTARYLSCLLKTGDATQGMNDLTNTGQCSVRRDAEIANYRVVHRGTCMAARSIIQQCAMAHHVLRCPMSAHAPECVQSISDVAHEADQALLYGPSLQAFCRDRLGASAGHSHPYPNVTGHVDHREATIHDLGIHARDAAADLAVITAALLKTSTAGVRRKKASSTTREWRSHVAQTIIRQQESAAEVFTRSKEAALETAERVRQRREVAADEKSAAASQRTQLRRSTSAADIVYESPGTDHSPIRRTQVQSTLMRAVRGMAEEDDNMEHNARMASLPRRRAVITSSRDDDSDGSDVEMEPGQFRVRPVGLHKRPLIQPFRRPVRSHKRARHEGRAGNENTDC